jgi:hypothetical protein
MQVEPLRMRPHHVEGAQRFIAFGKPGVKEMYALLEKAVAEYPDAEMIFVDSMEDPICQLCIKATRGRCRTVIEEGFPESASVDMDHEVAKEHGWEFGRRYRVQDILDEIRREAPGRTIFYNVVALKGIEIERDGIVRNAYEVWLEDIRNSKCQDE